MNASHRWLQRINFLRGNLKRAVLAQETLMALALALLLTAFEYFTLEISLRPYALLWQQHRYFVATGSILVIVMVWFWFVLFLRLSLTSNHLTKVFCLLVFGFAEFVEYGYQKTFAQFVTVEDLRIALFDANGEQRWNSIRTYMTWRASIPTAAFAITLWLFRNRSRHSWKPIAVWFVGVFVFFSALSPFTAGQFPTVSFNAFLRTLTLTPWKWASTYHGPREPIRAHAATLPQNNIILVIDESVRGDHLSINNYERDTTPILIELSKRGWIYNWGIASSGSTCSEKSDSLLLTGMKIEELPDLSFQIRKRASIFQYAKAMGYQTYLFDAQKDTFWLGTSYDQTYVDDWEPVSSFSTGAEFDRDAEVARKINRLINSSTGHFVWVVKRGIHFPYTTNFPVASSSTWQPSDTDETEVDPTTKQQLINTYDNALRYNLDSFFRNLDIEGWRNRTLMVYTSDHGQTLSEHGESYTHCGTSVATSPTEAMVPLFMISKEHLSVNAQFPATHANIFATLLDLMGVQESERVQQYEPSLFKTTGANSRPRYFWVGDLHERSLNGRVLFDR